MTHPPSPTAATVSRPRVIVAHKVFCALMLALGLLFVGIGLSLIAARGGIAASMNSFTSGPGSQRVISYHSSEQDRAGFYCIAGLAYAALYTVGVALKPRRASYVYLTALMPLGLSGQACGVADAGGQQGVGLDGECGFSWWDRLSST